MRLRLDGGGGSPGYDDLADGRGYDLVDERTHGVLPHQPYEQIDDGYDRQAERAVGPGPRLLLLGRHLLYQLLRPLLARGLIAPLARVFQLLQAVLQRQVEEVEEGAELDAAAPQASQRRYPYARQTQTEQDEDANGKAPVLGVVSDDEEVQRNEDDQSEVKDHTLDEIKAGLLSGFLQYAQAGFEPVSRSRKQVICWHTIPPAAGYKKSARIASARSIIPF